MSALSGRQKIVLAFVPLLILAAVLFLKELQAPPLVTPLSVTFTGWITNPVARMLPPPRLAAGLGATGICALFWVRNSGSSNETLWFETSYVEQKIDNRWHPFPLVAKGWQGVAGGVWPGGYGCFYAVGWPPGLPTNATWRLQVRCGRDRSIQELVARQSLGLDASPKKRVKGELHNVLSSSEVIP